MPHRLQAAAFFAPLHTLFKTNNPPTDSSAVTNQLPHYSFFSNGGNSVSSLAAPAPASTPTPSVDQRLSLSATDLYHSLLHQFHPQSIQQLQQSAAATGGSVVSAGGGAMMNSNSNPAFSFPAFNQSFNTAQAAVARNVSAAVNRNYSASMDDSENEDNNSPNPEETGGPKLTKRQRRNKLEVRRRQRIHEKIMELRELTGCSKVDSRSVLQSGIDEIHALSQRVQYLEQRLEEEKLARLNNQPYSSPSNSPHYDNPATVVSAVSMVNQAAQSGVIDFDDIYNKVSAAFGIVALDGHLIRVNSSMCSTFGQPREALEQMTIFDLVHGRTDVMALHARVQRLVDGIQDVEVMQTECTHNDGRPIPMMVMLFAVRQEDELINILWLGLKIRD